MYVLEEKKEIIFWIPLIWSYLRMRISHMDKETCSTWYNTLVLSIPSNSCGESFQIFGCVI